MPGWSDILSEVNSNLDVLRKKYITDLSNYTKRNVIVFYSGWLQVPELPPYSTQISDTDKTGLMNCCKGADKSKGLDLVLHTPGGNIGAAESIIDYLVSFYDGDIRAFVPQIAMSAGTLIATACKEIWMGRQSSIGPVDPQFGNFSAAGVLDQFEMIHEEITRDPSRLPLWLPVLNKFGPDDIIKMKRGIEWSQEILENNLRNGMFKHLKPGEQEEKIKKVSELLGQPKNSKAHDRHINLEKAKACGLNIKQLEDDNILQDKLLSLHHLICITLDSTKMAKIIASDSGATYLLNPSNTDKN
jgi:hypothetical protein